MSASHRICETCVYCSFAGNCDRYDKPLTSIEQPACDAYEMHPLLAENAKLRELVRSLHMAYIGIIGQCEDFDSALTWEFSSDIDAALAKQHASYEQDRHRFDVAMRELQVIQTEGCDE